MPVLKNGQQISLTELIRGISGDFRQTGGVRGKYRGNRAEQKGRHRGYILSGKLKVNAVDFPATLRTAALRGRKDADTLHIRVEDIRYKRYIGMEKTGVLFVVDASRSQGAQRRLAFAKGAVFSLLNQVYVRRDRAGMVIFGDKKASLVLPLTKSVEYAAQKLRVLPASGNTPLAMGLRLALRIMEQECRKDNALQPLIVLITDGKANYDEREGNPFELALEAAKQIREAKIPTVVIDTETGVFRLGLAKKLSDVMGAGCSYLELK